MKDDPVSELVKLLDEAGIEPTLDFQRDCTKPCVACGANDGPHDLIDIGTRLDSELVRRMGKKITRPVCHRCQETVHWGSPPPTEADSDDATRTP